MSLWQSKKYQVIQILIYKDIKYFIVQRDGRGVILGPILSAPEPGRAARDLLLANFLQCVLFPCDTLCKAIR